MAYEQRQHPRIPMQASASFEFKDGSGRSEDELSLYDLSEGGLGVEMQDPPAIGVEADVALVLPGTIGGDIFLPAVARIARIEASEHPGVSYVGLEFTYIAVADREHVRQFVSRRRPLA